MTADGQYSLLNRDNLTHSDRKQFSPKQKAFSQIFLPFSKSTLNFEHFQKKDDLHSLFISEITHSKRRGQIFVQKVLFQKNLWQATW